ncbi:hypothetical protein niasHT_009478 [Heterodera trifolii]|uniref:Uncharacterized protein n=1 Tax=Heterodera trifolii TaxID=157864 RepID=A0ABD2MG89_9BILA
MSTNVFFWTIALRAFSSVGPYLIRETDQIGTKADSERHLPGWKGKGGGTPSDQTDNGQKTAEEEGTGCGTNGIVGTPFGQNVLRGSTDAAFLLLHQLATIARLPFRSADEAEEAGTGRRKKGEEGGRTTVGTDGLRTEPRSRVVKEPSGHQPTSSASGAAHALPPSFSNRPIRSQRTPMKEIITLDDPTELDEVSGRQRLIIEHAPDQFMARGRGAVAIQTLAARSSTQFSLATDHGGHHDGPMFVQDPCTPAPGDLCRGASWSRERREALRVSTAVAFLGACCSRRTSQKCPFPDYSERALRSQMPAKTRTCRCPTDAEGGGSLTGTPQVIANWFAKQTEWKCAPTHGRDGSGTGVRLERVLSAGPLAQLANRRPTQARTLSGGSPFRVGARISSRVWQRGRGQWLAQLLEQTGAGNANVWRHGVQSAAHGVKAPLGPSQLPSAADSGPCAARRWGRPNNRSPPKLLVGPTTATPLLPPKCCWQVPALSVEHQQLLHLLAGRNLWPISWLFSSSNFAWSEHYRQADNDLPQADQQHLLMAIHDQVNQPTHF